MSPNRPNRQRGLTLVEGCVTLAVATLIVGAAVPSFERAVERRHIEGTAAQLETDLQQARSLAVTRNESVRVGFEANSETSCYVIHTGGAGDCSCLAEGGAVCRAGAHSLHLVRIGAGTRVHSNSRSMLFDPLKGTVTPTATIQVQGRSGVALNEVVNIMGRVRSCSPGGALPGYRVC